MFTKKPLEKTSHTLLYHHLGLGDYIIISGGLKYLRRKNKLGPVFCICKHNYLNSVKQLYADVEDFEIVAVNGWQEADILAAHWKGEKLLIGFEKMINWYHFDRDFYRIIDVDFNERWNSFTIKRNEQAENNLLNELNLPVKFAFVHDDPSRGYVINTDYVDSVLPVVKPHLTNSIFDWIAVLERATEIHCMCSSFKHLVDSLTNITAELFYHYSYVNDGKPREASISESRKNWKII